MRGIIKKAKQGLNAINCNYHFCTSTNQSLYKILEVSPDASFEQVKKNYLQKSKAAHPDSATGSQANFIAIQQAYSILSNPSKRKLYDKSIGMEFSLWEHQEFNLKDSAFQNQQQFQEILTRKESYTPQSAKDILLQKLDREQEGKKFRYGGLLMPGVIFVGFWACWEVGQTVLLGYKGEKKYEAKVSEQGKKLSSFVAEIR